MLYCDGVLHPDHAVTVLLLGMPPMALCMANDGVADTDFLKVVVAMGNMFTYRCTMAPELLEVLA